jgi:hypothetical protein
MKEKKQKPFKLSGNAIVDRRALIQLIVAYLESFSYDGGTVVGSLVVYLYKVPDAAKVRLLVESTAFREELIAECLERSIETNRHFTPEVKIEEPPTDEAQEVSPGIWLRLPSAAEAKTEATTTVAAATPKAGQTKARITVLKGELYQPAYLLDGELQAVYNIGRGERPQLSTGAFSVNHIAIREEAHRSISREHAYIIFTPEEGFRLMARRGGTTLAGNATCLFRLNGERIELIDTTQSAPLQQGDQLKFGIRERESVVLLFEFEK